MHPSGSGILHEVRAGGLLHDVDGLWSGSRKESGFDLNAELVFGQPHLNVWSGTLYPNLGASINNDGDTSFLYLGLIWEHRMNSGMFLNLGIGGALHSGKLDPAGTDKKGLGSRVLFRIPLELGYRFDLRHGISLIFVHHSNGYLSSPNEGLDQIGLRYGYRF